MYSWWKSRKQLPKGQDRPLIHEPMKWDADATRAYGEWQESLEKKRLLNQLLDAFLVWQRRGDTLDPAIDLSNTPMHRGFIVYASGLSYPFTTYRFLLELLKDRMKDTGYRLALNDALTRDTPRGLETVYRYYLKPPVSDFAAEGRAQRFGNVKLELLVRDDRVQHLQCLSTIYQDRNYLPPEDFQALMESLLLGGNA